MTYRKKINLISWIISIVAVNNVIVLTPSFGAPYYAIMILLLIYCLFQSRVKSIDIGILCLYFCCILSIVGNNIPSFFKPWGRFVSFVLMTMLLSPFLKSDVLRDTRINTFFIIQQLLEYVIIASTVAYFGGFAYRTGYFAGITSHSMLIAPIAANVIVTSIYKLTNKEYEGKNIKLYYYCLLICCGFVCILLSASRTAILAIIVSLLCYIFLINKQHFIKFIKYIVIIAAILAISYPLWSDYLDVVLEKNEGSVAAGGIASSRDSHWENRIAEFKSSPIYGIGFSTVSTTSTTGSTFDTQSGGIETGSSWLSALSMMGILGFLSLIFIFINAFKQFYRINRYSIKLSAYMISMLVFWSVHMMAEGYIWGAGGFLFFNVWLIIGCADALANKFN